MASPSAGAQAPNYGDVNIETTSPGEVKGLIIILKFSVIIFIFKFSNKIIYKYMIELKNIFFFEFFD